MNANRYALLVMGIATGYLAGDNPNSSSGEWRELKASRTGGDRASHIKLLREAHAALQVDSKTAESNVSESPAPLKPADGTPG